MSFPYNNNIPQPSDIPSQSQAQFLTNFGSIDAILAVDHVSFGNTTGGQHEQITFNANNPPGGAPAGDVSILYTNVGTANPAIPQLFWRNAAANFHFPIRAWCYFDFNGNIVGSQAVNVTSVTRPGVGQYDVVLLPACVTGGSFSVICTSAIGPGGFKTTCNYQITGANTFTIFVGRPENTAFGRDANVTFMVLQI